jgi:hypothetical protein
MNKPRCDWQVRRAQGDRFVFVECGKRATLITTGFAAGAHRCRCHTPKPKKVRRHAKRSGGVIRTVDWVGLDDAQAATVRAMGAK